MPARHHHAHLFRHQLGLALAADAGGVDEDVFHAVMQQALIHGIARGAGHRRDDGPLLAHQRIQQRGFADVRAANDRHFDGGASPAAALRDRRRC